MAWVGYNKEQKRKKEREIKKALKMKKNRRYERGSENKFVKEKENK